MTSYLLLRDNKERGPYTLDQIVQVGFKPYDLVWIQGKSAAWRYPGEVEELKAYAPAVEEQPFDRFFKKKTDDKKIETHDELPRIPVYEKREVRETSKSIYVTMPNGKKERIIKEDPPEVPKTIIVSENPAAAQIKYPEPVEELKEVYAKNFQERKQKIARKSLIFQRVKKASVFFYMIALGVLIGFTIKSYSGKKSIVASEKIDQPPAVVNEPPQNTNSGNEEVLKTNPVKSELKEDLTLSSEVNTQSEQKQVPIEKNDLAIQKKEILNNKKIDTSQISPGLDINPITGERAKKSRMNDDSEENTSLNKKDISSQVRVEGSDYKRGAFGGIRDLQLTVVNNSKYILDNVIVELEYIKANEMPLKTDNIQFHSVSPNGSMTIAIPPTNRGVKVNYKIIKIESKALSDETAGL